MEQYYEAIDLLKGMISRPSFSREETAVADYLQKCWSDAGHHLFRKGNNLWIIAPGFDFAKPTLLLNSHIDTVKPAAGWQKDPFLPEETEDDRLYGLGSNDAGASVVSLYEAFTILSAKAQPYNLIFLASCEEEVSGKNGIECVLPELPPIRFAVVGEPTGMRPAIAEKGLMVLDCVATGKAGHAARNEGVNAIYKAIEDINWFSTYQFPRSRWVARSRPGASASTPRGPSRSILSCNGASCWARSPSARRRSATRRSCASLPSRSARAILPARTRRTSSSTAPRSVTRSPLTSVCSTASRSSLCCARSSPPSVPAT